jgi:hypothetical protein
MDRTDWEAIANEIDDNPWAEYFGEDAGEELL